jgi:hypothetical protein
MVKSEFEITLTVQWLAALSVFLPLWFSHCPRCSMSAHLSSPSPTERFSYVALGNDWPSTMPNREPKAFATTEPKRRYNPIRRAWRRRTLLRIFSRRS